MKYTNGRLKTILGAIILIGMSSCSSTNKIRPEKPTLIQSDFNLDSLPTSEVNIPIQISLRPLYAMAEKNVDTLFSSPGYPDGWVQLGCDMRYKYVFRRSPLQMKAVGTSLDLGFTGFYKIVGSTRVCVMGAAVSPWTPPCRCGFSEPERRVNVSFTNSLLLQPDYKVKLNIRRNEPQPLDKCEVCVWGQDITSQVVNGLKAELDVAKAELEKNYGTVDLRPRFQEVWNQLNEVYNIYGMGWLQLNPQRIRINNLYAKDDSLHVFLGLSAKPVISFEKPREYPSALPGMGGYNNRQGFSIFLDALLSYDSLSQIINRQLANKEFDLNKGPVKKKFIIKECTLYGEGNEKLIVKIDFAGTNSGTFYLTGRPVYDQAKKTIEVKDMDFDIKSKNMLLKTADWLFSRAIVNEISKYTRYDLTSYIDTAKSTINNQLNREWIKGVSSYGKMDDINLIGIYPKPQHLHIRSNCTGNLSVKVEAAEFSL